MAKRRNLKKFIKYTSGSITGFILWEISRAKEEKRPAYDQLLANIIDLHNDMVSRIQPHRTGKRKRFLQETEERLFGRHQRDTYPNRRIRRTKSKHETSPPVALFIIRY